jgi:DNA-binding transcriptional MerR regulator
MSDSPDDRRLTIGAYAAATQLTAKALRLYDEYGLLRPTTTDAATGYRYYRAEQVATGRLIRSLRDMNCSLAQIAQMLEAPSGLRPTILRAFLQEAEQRLARERTAYQSALLMMMRPGRASDAQQIEVVTAPARIVTVTDFSTNRYDFIKHALRHHEETIQQLSSLGLQVHPEFALSLVEPLSDEEGRVELLSAIDVRDRAILQGVTTRHLADQRFASIDAGPADLTDGFTACVDGLFDWFDRRGARALGFPEVVLTAARSEWHAQVRWAIHDDNGAR